MIAYTTQDRMTDFMERIGLRDLTVDAFGESARDRLYEIAKFALEHGSEVRERFLQARASLREDVRRFNSVVYDFLTA